MATAMWLGPLELLTKKSSWRRARPVRVASSATLDHRLLAELLNGVDRGHLARGRRPRRLEADLLERPYHPVDGDDIDGIGPSTPSYRCYCPWRD